MSFERFEEALSLIRHRGPDAKGFYISDDRKIFFGHRRLKIQDLSDRANQPMYDSTREYAIIFNGEIYNFQSIKKQLQKAGKFFYSTGDTEVLLEAYKHWGLNFVKKLKGMFVFSIYDKKNSKIYIFRDISGEKPIYFTYENKNISFSSEIKCLVHENPNLKEINEFSLKMYLALGFIPGENSIFKKIKKLESGCFLTYCLNEGSLKKDKYWHLPKFDETRNHSSQEELLEELDLLLKNSVANQLLADVPVGIMLSGGLDSSLIALYASKVNKKIKTYNVSFPSYKEFDESSYAKLVSNFIQSDHTEINAEDISHEILDNFAFYFDEPIADSSLIPSQVLSKELRKFCKVALGGDGGDELFGGYNHYNRLVFIDNFFSFFPKIVREKISREFSSLLPLGKKGKNWIEAVGFDLEKRLPNLSSYFEENLQNKILKRDLSHLSSHLEKEISNMIIKDNDLIQSLTRTDFKNYLAEDILVKVDRSSMMHSLEVRAPFLDKDIVEFAFKKVPSKFKVNSLSKKILLKKLGKKLLPDNLNLNRKQGFSIPLNDWLKKDGRWRNIFEEVLLDDSSIFNKKEVISLFESQDKGLNNKDRIFNLFVFEKWKKEFNLQF